MTSFKNPDFFQLISSIQTVVQGFNELQKISSSKLHTALNEAIAEIQGASDDLCENTHFAEKTKLLLQEPAFQRPPLGASLIYGSHSSPLLRVIPVFYALKNRCSVVFLCDKNCHDIYTKLLSVLVQKGLPEKSLALISTQETESLETLIAHPSLKAIHFDGQHYEGAFLKKIALPLFKKRIRVHLGGRNPVIFTHDAPLEQTKELLSLCLERSYLSEHSFNRWFVQDKNYAEFIKHLEDLLPSLQIKNKNSSVNYVLALQEQNESLFKEKNWKHGAISLSPDFNNCSPWQQKEVLGNILTITRFKNTAEAIKFANTTNYASASAVFSGSKEKAMEISQQLSMPHRFSQMTPDMGALPATLGLSDTGFGQHLANKDFFIF